MRRLLLSILIILFAQISWSQDLTLQDMKDLLAKDEAGINELLTSYGWVKDGSKRSWYYGKEKSLAEVWVDLKTNDAGGNYLIYQISSNDVYKEIKDGFKEESSMYKSKMKSPNFYYSYKSESLAGIFIMRKTKGVTYGSYSAIIAELNGFDELWEYYKNQ